MDGNPIHSNRVNVQAEVSQLDAGRRCLDLAAMTLEHAYFVEIVFPLLDFALDSKMKRQPVLR